MPTIIFTMSIFSFLIMGICIVCSVWLSKLQDVYKDNRLTRIALFVLLAGVLEFACWLLATLYVVDHCLNLDI